MIKGKELKRALKKLLMTISSILTWVVLKVLEVDVGDVLVLHQVHLQVVLRAMHLVVRACNILPSISILFAGELS